MPALPRWTGKNACPTKMDQRKRIAIYGGTFDPIHVGHLEIARSISQLFAIDEFLFVPARVAPHKQHAQTASALDRYAMLALATQDHPQLRVSTFELEKPATQYTVDSLNYFRLEFGEFADLFFVMGADSWAEITSWREWETLLSLANHIVVTRPAYEITTTDVGPAWAARVTDVRGLADRDVDELVELGTPRAPKIFITDAVMQDVSATAIRKAAREERVADLLKLTPRAVAQYITKYRLYRNSHEA